MDREKLQERVVKAAEAALGSRSCVSAIDVFVGIGWLNPKAVEDWRRGRERTLERVIQANLSKISDALRLLRSWAELKGLKPSETHYMRWGRGVKQELQFSRSGNETIERVYRTHYFSPALAEKTREKLTEKLEKPKEPVVYSIVRQSRCSECGAELAQGDLLTMDAEQPLCLPCAGMGDLVFLPSGDAALTRRSGKYSQRSAVVVRFSRSRARYERQGLMVEETALARAEEECAADAEVRAREREASARARAKADKRFGEEFAVRIAELYPRCPPEEALRIAAHTAARGSGRVGRGAAGRALHPKAVELAVRAYVRHAHTRYDELLLEENSRENAREEVRDRVEEVMRRWE